MADEEQAFNPDDFRKRAQAALSKEEYRRKYRRLAFVSLYEPQRAVIAATRDHREALLMGSNQSGKTFVGAYATTAHLTGLYPADWPGRRFDEPTKIWATGETALVVRDVIQRTLIGEPGVAEAQGTGLIPLDCIEKISLSRGVSDAIDTVQVKHVSGGTSLLRFKSYEQGASRFASDTIHFAWLDEPPPADVYNEAIARISVHRGYILTTFTPINWANSVVYRFTEEPSPQRALVNMTIDDAKHFTPEQRREIVDGYAEHERDARAYGIPALGSGAVFKTSVSEIAERLDPGAIAAHWAWLWAIDSGISDDHPFAAVLCAWDRSSDTIHIVHAIKLAKALPAIHVQAMREFGGNGIAGIPVTYGHDGGHTTYSEGGRTKAQIYKAHGLEMLPKHATFADGKGIDFEAGIMAMSERFATGRLKVAEYLTDWFTEYRSYHRKERLVVKQRDDLMSATRFAVMQIRSARTYDGGMSGYGPGEPRRRKGGGSFMASGRSFDDWD